VLCSRIETSSESHVYRTLFLFLPPPLDFRNAIIPVLTMTTGVPLPQRGSQVWQPEGKAAKAEQSLLSAFGMDQVLSESLQALCLFNQSFAPIQPDGIRSCVRLLALSLSTQVDNVYSPRRLTVTTLLRLPSGACQSSFVDHAAVALGWIIRRTPAVTLGIEGDLAEYVKWHN
jgi:hypothetical protein